ncbi:MAG: glycosyltransferase [Candidatus Kerfeldbacteria bacterium]
MEQGMISVGIPAYNEEKTIRKAIKAVLPQIGPDDEVLVVASACTDNTIDEARSLGDPRIRVIEQKEKAGKVSAINIIMREAKHKYILLLDADVIAADNAIEKLMAELQKDDVGAVSAKIINYKRENFWDKLQGFGWYALDHQKMEENANGMFWALNGFLAGVKKGIIGPLDETSLVDDAILGWEVKQAGYKCAYVPEAHVFVQAAQNWQDYKKQKIRVRVGWWQMTEKGMNFSDRRNWRQLKYFLTNLYAWPYIVVDGIIWLKARSDYRKRKFIWEQIKTSKI